MPPRILVVDDSEMVLEATQLALEEAGIEVTAISSPALFPATLNRRRPDLVLLDVSMPILGGESLVELAKKSQLHQCPILLYSDRPADQLQALVKTCGANGYVRKTSDRSALLEQVRAYLPTRPARPVAPADEVYLVDDQRIVRSLLQEYLRRCGCRPILIASAEECLALARLRPPALVVIDLQMPGMGGDEACREMKTDPVLRSVPVIVMTGRAEPATIMRCCEYGADDFLPKPVRPDQLEAKIRAVLRRGDELPQVLSHRHQRVLLATGDTFHRSQIGLGLECSGYRVRYASSLGETASALDEPDEVFEAAVCDARMFSGDSGTALLERLRMRPKVKLLVMVPDDASADQRARFAGWSRDFTALLNPPHTAEMVLTVVNGLLKQIAAELRLAERVPFYSVVEFRQGSEGPWASGFTHDLSPSGLFIRTLTPVTRGTTLEFRLGEWPPGDSVEGSAVVAWSNEYALRTSYSYPVGMGLQLSGVGSTCQRRLKERYDRARKSTG